MNFEYVLLLLTALYQELETSTAWDIQRLSILLESTSLPHTHFLIVLSNQIFKFVEKYMVHVKYVKKIKLTSQDYWFTIIFV